MKKIITILFLIALSCTAYAQDKVMISYTISATGAAATIPGTYLYHSFSWNIIGGTLSACNIDLEGSDNNTSWSNLIAAQDCSAKGKATLTYGLYKYYRLYVNTITTATGTPRLEVVYYGYIDSPSSSTMQGVVDIAGTTYADASTQTARLATDASIATFAQGKVNTSTPTYSDGDIKPLSITGSGALRVDAGLTTDSAHGATFSEAPVGIGLEGLSTERAVVDATDKVKAAATTSGVVIVMPGALPGDFFEYSAEITNTSWATIKAPAADYYYVVTFVKVVNSDATVGTKVTFYDDDDGDVGDSAIKDGGYAAALGGGWVAANPSGVFSTGTANHGLYVACTSDSSETHVTVRGYRTKIKPVM